MPAHTLKAMSGNAKYKNIFNGKKIFNSGKRFYSAYPLWKDLSFPSSPPPPPSLNRSSTFNSYLSYSFVFLLLLSHEGLTSQIISRVKFTRSLPIVKTILACPLDSVRSCTKMAPLPLSSFCSPLTRARRRIRSIPCDPTRGCLDQRRPHRGSRANRQACAVHDRKPHGDSSVRFPRIPRNPARA